MTVITKIGRRVPKSWFKRTAVKAKGLLSFQENIWLMISQAFKVAKNQANASDTGIKFEIIKDLESEDLHYQIEWMIIIVQGTEKQEKEEHEEAQMLYKNVQKHMQKEIPQDPVMKKHFKTKILSSQQVQNAYKEGHGSMHDSNMAAKLLEMGILTHIEWKKDFDNRVEDF